MAEEATVYGTLGSRAMVSQLEPADLELPAFDGRSVADHLRAAGFDPAQAHTAARAPGTVAAYLELHIEQGDQLASERIPIGLVEGIVGIRRYQVRFAGQANHAGTTPMLRRRDALIAAARFVLAVQERAAAAGIVGTTGTLAIAPNVPNVIPGQATLTCEIRGMDDATLDQVAAELHADAQSWHGTMTPISAKSPVASDLQLLTILAQCCQQLELPFCQLPSGAGHDAMNMAALAPQAMIFIPSQAGISHAPEEYSDDSDCVAGARLLLAAILALDTAL
jgi:N-carbamoyl-L-amino-acid hydrolase